MSSHGDPAHCRLPSARTCAVNLSLRGPAPDPSHQTVVRAGSRHALAPPPSRRQATVTVQAGLPNFLGSAR
jgi:hypothetical protein